jgi:L-amino acid N-acyltransferase YncA
MLTGDSPRIQQWMHERSKLPLHVHFHGIAQTDARGDITAAFGFDSFQERGCALHLCAAAPLTKGLLRATFRTAFRQWGYRYLACIISADNVRSLNMARRLGFKEVGVVPGELWYGVLYPADCKWLSA